MYANKIAAFAKYRINICLLVMEFWQKKYLFVIILQISYIYFGTNSYTLYSVTLSILCYLVYYHGDIPSLVNSFKTRSTTYLHTKEQELLPSERDYILTNIGKKHISGVIYARHYKTPIIGYANIYVETIPDATNETFIKLLEIDRRLKIISAEYSQLTVYLAVYNYSFDILLNNEIVKV